MNIVLTAYYNTVSMIDESKILTLQVSEKPESSVHHKLERKIGGI